MKRLTAFLLTAGLLLQNAVSIQAAVPEAVPPTQTAEESTTAATQDAEQEESLAEETEASTEEVSTAEKSSEEDSSEENSSEEISTEEASSVESSSEEDSTEETSEEEAEEESDTAEETSEEESEEESDTAEETSEEESEEESDTAEETSEEESEEESDTVEEITEESTEATSEVESTAVDKTPVKVQTAKNGVDSADWMDAIVQNNAAGGINITLGSVLPMYRDVAVSATMTNRKTGAMMTADAVLASGAYSKDIFIGGLESGSYTLRLKAAGFVDYVQNVEVKGNILNAYVGTGMVSLDGISYEAGSTHPGLFLVGDVDGDGMITEADKNAIMDAAAGKQVEAYTDLNGDGKTDILDLQYYAFAENVLSRGTDRTASITESISSQAAAVKVNDNNTLVTGDVNDILTGNGMLTFQTADNSAITEDNPRQTTSML